eukprot:12933885-Prorocentrum_lima.AAC.1
MSAEGLSPLALRPSFPPYIAPCGADAGFQPTCLRSYCPAPPTGDISALLRSTDHGLDSGEHTGH